MFWPIDEIRNALEDAISWAIEKLFHFAAENTSTTDRVQERANYEVSQRSLNPDMFRTEMGKEHAKQLKEELAGSPQGAVDWLDALYGPFVGQSAPEVLFETLGIEDEDVPPTAQEVLDLMGTMSDAEILFNYIDTITELLPLPTRTDLTTWWQQLMQTSGMSMLAGYGMGTALGSAISPPIAYAINQAKQPIIPSAPDLRQFQVKEVYKGLEEASIEEISERAQKHVGEPHAWVDMPTWRGKQLVPYPPDRYFENMAKQGFDRYFAEDMWAAHWEEPSYRRSREMLGRLGPDILEENWEDYVDITPVENPSKQDVIDYVSFTPEDMDRLMRFRDVNPYWRAKLEAIAYRPYTRVDVRRMYERGVFREEPEDVDAEIERLSEQDPQFDAMYRAFREQRYPKKKALNMAEFYIRWANREIIDIEQEQILDSFRRGEITEEEAVTSLERLLERPELVSSLIAQAKSEGPERTPTKKELQGFLKMEDGLSEEEVRQYLRWDGYEEKIIDLYIQTWTGGES